MDILKQSAIAFKKLFSYEYQLTAGSKQTLIDLTLAFYKENYMHLVGLHKLTDLQLQRYSKEKLFNLVINGDLTYADITKSVFFPQIESRLKYFPMLEEILDSNDLIIKYKHGFVTGSFITAEYIIVYPYNETTLHYFLVHDADTEKYIGKSFFDRTDNKFVAGQQTFKVLKKYKKNILNNEGKYLINKEIKKL